MPLRSPLLAPCSLLLMAAVLATASTLSATEPLARIGSAEVDLQTVRDLLPVLDAGQQRALAADPAAQNQLVRSLLVQRLVLEKARADQWDQRPDTLRQLRQAQDAALTESYLRAVSLVPEGYPAEAELKAFYDANARALLQPPRFRLAQIFVSAPSADPAVADPAQARLDAILASLAAPDADFAALARRFSDEPNSAAQGGEVGWIAEAQLRPELRPLLSGLQAGGVSAPVRLADGWHIVKCLELQPGRPAPFEDVRAALAERMRAERAAANRQAYLARLLQENPVAINELGLRGLFAPEPAPAP